MTQVGRLFEEEKQEAVKEAIKETELKKSREIAKSFLDILPPEEVAKRTNLDLDEVRKLMDN